MLPATPIQPSFLLPHHQHLIGHVILDKNQPNIRTVVNKVGLG